MKKLVFKDREFYAEKIVKTEKSIIFYINNEEVNRLQPLGLDLTEYRIYNADGTLGEFDSMEFSNNVITTGTDLMRLLYAIMKENTVLQAKIKLLEGANK